MSETYRLNNLWLIQPQLNRISNDKKNLTIPSKYMEVLHYLIKNSGEVVSREELLSTIWLDTIVVEESLTRAISELRKILMDDPRDSKIIETIPKKGYRLIADVTLEYTKRRNQLGISPIKKRPYLKYILRGIIICAAGFFIWNKWFSNPVQPVQPVHLMPLTSYPGQESFPALSPDGNRLAFRWDGEDGFNASIYVKVIGSENPLRLTYSGFTTEPAWSPDGRFITYLKNTEQGRAIYSVPSSSGPEKRIAQNLFHARHPSWSPDGDELLYSQFSSEKSSTLLYIYNILSRTTTQITFPLKNRTFDSKAVFSPDGQRIVFIRTCTGEKDVYTISADGSNLKKVTGNGQWITDVDWSPDGRWVIYSSKEGIWKIHDSGGRAILLTAGGMRIENISVARKSWRLAYEQSNREENIWSITLPGLTSANPEPKRFISSSRSDSEPVFSPDGRQIAFISDRTGDPQLWICRRDGSNLAQLTHFNGCRVNLPRWSYDGLKITFSARLYGNSDIFIVNAEGGEPVQITRDHSRELTSSFSHDGQWIYYTSNKQEKLQILKKPIDGGAAILVSSNGGYRPTESADGQTVFYEKVTESHQGIWEKPVNGGREKKLFILQQSWIGDWTVTSNGIYYSKRTRDRHYEIGFYDFTSRTVTPLFQTDKSFFSFGFDPESRIALFSREERDEGDIVLMENFQ